MPASKAAIFAACGIFLLVFGCVQLSLPEECRSLPQSKQAECIYRKAVLEQNPSFCYLMDDIAKRAACLKHATDASAKRQLQNVPAEESLPDEPEQPPAAEPAPQQQPPQKEQEGCAAKFGEEKDSCIRDLALASKDILVCEKIASSSIKASCVAKVAMVTKDLESCKTLAEESARSICRAYAKGENPSQ
ncbi:MAG: hypothetical protein N3F07_00615 [Candidatus Micrarchaeota archaeon]|nr:hypothetical protein [Candidatus Micrarchaeota archaeon]